MKKPKVKGVSVDLPAELHQRVKAAGIGLGLSVPEAYTAALILWLEKVGAGWKGETSPFGDISRVERRLLLGLLEYIRDNALDEVQVKIKDLIESVGKSRGKR